MIEIFLPSYIELFKSHVENLEYMKDQGVSENKITSLNRAQPK